MERKISEAHPCDQERLLDEPQLSTPNNVNSIFDEESFKRWFRKYTETCAKENPQSTQDEELKWKKYKKTVLDNPYIKWKPQLTENGRSPPS